MTTHSVHRKRDVHQHVTDHIIAAIEAGAGDWRMPWHRSRTSYGARSRPVNMASETYENMAVDAEIRTYPRPSKANTAASRSIALSRIE